MVIDVRNVNIKSFNESIALIDSITESIESFKTALKDERDNLAEELGVNKKEIINIIKMYKRIETGEEPIDGELVSSIEELYSKISGE